MVRVDHLYKIYKIYQRPSDRLKEWLTPRSMRFHRDFVALNDVSFGVDKGRSVGIVGANGAGKTTLLKILAGTTQPTSGTVEVQGSMAALLELGMGFHPDFTGRQNIMMSGRMLGMKEEEIGERMEEIISFSELGDFIDRPLRTYSSGMQVRLGFAVATSVSLDLLIIDEALSVGDAYFQQKCIRKIKEFKTRGVTILFVSHDPGMVKTLCDEALLLDEGRLVDVGNPEEVLEYYTALLARKASQHRFFTIDRRSSSADRRVGHRLGTFQAVITEVHILNAKGEATEAVIAGERVGVQAQATFLTEIENPTFGFLIRDRLGNDVFGTNTFHQHVSLGRYRPGDRLKIQFNFDMNIGPGEYTLTVALHSLDVHLYDCYDWADRILIFKVLPSMDFRFIGTAKLVPTVQFKQEVAEGFEDASRILGEVFADAPSCLDMGPSSDRFLSMGWYGVEGEEPTWFRWTEGAFSFILRPQGSKVHLQLSSAQPDIAEHPVKGIGYAYTTPLGKFILDTPGPIAVALTFPDEYQDTVVPFRVVLNRTWRPSELLGAADERELGVTVHRIWSGGEQDDSAHAT